MTNILYTFVYAAVGLLSAPWALMALATHKHLWTSLPEWLGLYSKATREALGDKEASRCWIHAVCAGEVNAALTFIEAFRRRFPRTRIVLTTTTQAGHQMAEQKRVAGITVLHFPADIPLCMARAFRLIQPDLIVLVEMELWPNHLRMAHDEKVPVVLINARMPVGDARRYRLGRSLFRDLFAGLRLVCAQDEEHASRFRELGVPADRIFVVGNLKYDAWPIGNPVPQMTGMLSWIRKQARPVWVCGSTHRGEEDAVFRIFTELRREFPDLFLVVAPRHVERTPALLTLAGHRGVRLIRRSSVANGDDPGPQRWDGLLLDVMGELSGFYREATVVFVGKSLVGRGGQNIIEAAAGGHPVVFGPYMENFESIAHQFVSAGGAAQIRDTRDLQTTVAEFLRDANRREATGAAARRVIEANRGVADRTVSLLAGRREIARGIA